VEERAETRESKSKCPIPALHVLQDNKWLSGVASRYCFRLQVGLLFPAEIATSICCVLHKQERLRETEPFLVYVGKTMTLFQEHHFLDGRERLCAIGRSGFDAVEVDTGSDRRAEVVPAVPEDVVIAGVLDLIP
jgi:hypothetical protein